MENSANQLVATSIVPIPDLKAEIESLATEQEVLDFCRNNDVQAIFADLSCSPAIGCCRVNHIVCFNSSASAEARLQDAKGVIYRYLCRRDITYIDTIQ